MLMAPPAEPEAVVEIVPSLTAPFLPTNPSGDSVLHAGQWFSWYPDEEKSVVVKTSQ